MIQAYNFLASWQLFPERGIYEYGERPKSGFYKIESFENKKGLYIQHNWVSLENQAFHAEYNIVADGEMNPFEDPAFAEYAKVFFPDSIRFEIHFFTARKLQLAVTHEIMPNGYLKVIQQGLRPDNSSYTNTEIFHKQFSVLPYAASVSGAVIRPTEEGVIRHKSLTAMEEQTNMQLEQIRKQIELLALQAHEIQKRKELSMIIYGTKLSFAPVIGQIYYLYERTDASHFLSMVSPKEWGGGSGPFKQCMAAVKLLADHTWMEI